MFSCQMDKYKMSSLPSQYNCINTVTLKDVGTKGEWRIKQLFNGLFHILLNNLITAFKWSEKTYGENSIVN
jgi:hypothetical protein